MTPSELAKIVEAIREVGQVMTGALTKAVTPAWPAAGDSLATLQDGHTIALCDYTAIDLVFDCGYKRPTTVTTPHKDLLPIIGTCDGNSTSFRWKGDTWSNRPPWIITGIACNKPDAVVTFTYRCRPTTFQGADLLYGRPIRPVMPIGYLLDWFVTTDRPAFVTISGILAPVIE